MSFHTQFIQRLTSDKRTIEEATSLFSRARASTGVGSGFDLGEDRTGLAAVCAYLASQKLNNTNVTFEAAQVASCQTKPKFKKLHERVAKALETPKPARRKPLKYSDLILEHYPRLIRASIPWMQKVEDRVKEKVDEDEDEDEDEGPTADEVTCAVFMWFCNTVEKQRLFHPKSFEDRYETDTAHMRKLNNIIASCALDVEKIRADYDAAAHFTKSASVSPRKSPTKPALRTLPSRDSPQKRKVTFPDAEEDADVPDSPTKRRKVAPGLVTLESIRSMSSSPTKLPLTPSTPRKALRLPSKSPTKQSATATPSRAVDLDATSSDEEDYEPPPRRRFRPVFRDQEQWCMRDPRLTELAEAAVKFEKLMIQRHGVPFQDARRDLDATESD
ncbi:hypothetical protein B0H14DRAFT_3852057 [Mycena olivaceomarginata]|nr:hypothetical protein B0H14DRAFT_3852057 [Mycena olivaceomarginata]